MDDSSRREELLQRISELMAQMPEDLIQELIVKWEIELMDFAKDGIYASQWQETRVSGVSVSNFR